MLAADVSDEVSRFGASLASSELAQQAERGELTRAQVAAYLHSTRYLVRHTPLHLARAEAQARQRNRPELATFFRHKLAEERGHDRWADADLRTLGLEDPDAEPLAGMRELVDFVAGVIDRDPRLYLAYILFAEQLVVEQGPTWLDSLERAGYGRPTVVSRHVELDAEHAAEGKVAIERFAPGLGPELVEVVRGAGQRFARYCNELAELS